jgi:hypothetical protein
MAFETPTFVDKQIHFKGYLQIHQKNSCMFLGPFNFFLCYFLLVVISDPFSIFLSISQLKIGKILEIFF